MPGGRLAGKAAVITGGAKGQGAGVARRFVAEFDFDDANTARVMGVPGAQFKGIFMQRDGMRIEIIGFRSPPPEPARRGLAFTHPDPVVIVARP